VSYKLIKLTNRQINDGIDVQDSMLLRGSDTPIHDHGKIILEERVSIELLMGFINSDNISVCP